MFFPIITLSIYLHFGSAIGTDYLVTIHTGNEYWSGTGAKVRLQLYGSQDNSDSILLPSTSSQFLVGSIDTFTISTLNDLGKIERVRLQHDNTGSHPGWLVKRVDVEGPSSAVYTFPINTWLDSSNGNSVMANSEQLRQGSCGIQASSRVVNGVTAKKNNWPWMVHLKMSGLTASSTCGGTLIHPQYVLTAAHCLTHFPSPSSMTLTLGDHDRSSTETEEQYAYAEEYILHPKYNAKLLQNDLAIIKLQNPVVLNDFVKLACLPAKNEYVNRGKRCYATGWGRLGHNKKTASLLQEVSLSVLGKGNCNYYFRIPILPSMLCAKERGKTICMGDSGGPLQCMEDNKYFVQGVASFVAGGCKTGYPAVFTRVSSFLGWIESVLTTKITTG